jgi:hypothetical protein
LRFSPKDLVDVSDISADGGCHKNFVEITGKGSVLTKADRQVIALNQPSRSTAEPTDRLASENLRRMFQDYGADGDILSYVFHGFGYCVASPIIQFMSQCPN